jgi:plasmid stabilization system protein ParE
VRLRYTKHASRELAAILDYILERSPQGARRVHSRINALTKLLVRFPQLGVLTSTPLVRRVVAKPYPYAIYYYATATEIIVLSIRHTARSGA